MDIAASGWIQALKKGRHESPYAEGGAQEPMQYMGVIDLWIPLMGTMARFTFEWDEKESGAISLIVKQAREESGETAYQVLPEKSNATPKEIWLRSVFRAITRPMFNEANIAAVRGDTYRRTPFRTGWRMNRKKIAMLAEFITTTKTIH